MRLQAIRWWIGMFNPLTIWRDGIRLWFAQIVSACHGRACWVDMYEWSQGEREWHSVNWHCTDMETSGCDRCWCGKITKDETPSTEPAV